MTFPSLSLSAAAGVTPKVQWALLGCTLFHGRAPLGSDLSITSQGLLSDLKHLLLFPFCSPNLEGGSGFFLDCFLNRGVLLVCVYDVCMHVCMCDVCVCTHMLLCVPIWKPDVSHWDIFLNGFFTFFR